MSSSLSAVLFLFTFYYPALLHLPPFPVSLSMTDNDSMNLNTLCNFANGTFVTLDDCLPDTGYEPNVMKLTDVMDFAGTTELNDAASSDIQLPGFPRLHSPFVRPLHRRRRTRPSYSQKYTEITRLPPCGRCKCQSVVSVSHGRSNGGTCGRDDC